MNLLLLASSLSFAAEPAALRVEVDAGTALDAPAIAQALGSELDTPVLLEGDAPARVTVRAQGPDTIAIVYEGEDGVRRERVVELPHERAESTRIVVLLVVNLARDQVGELGLAAAPAAEDREEAGGDAVVEDDAPAEAVERAVRREPSERRFHLGVGVQGGAVSVGERVEPFMVGGLEAGWRVTPRLQLGVTRMSIGAGGSTGDDAGDDFFFQVHGTPYAELSGWVGERVEPFGRVGVMIRGKNESSRADGWFEAAPYVGGGARFYATRAFAIGLEVGANMVVTQEATVGGVRLPQGSLPGTVGLSTTFHF